MPTYEYVCDPCELVDEEVRTYEKRDDPMECPKCDAPMKRQFAAPTYIRVVDRKMWKNVFNGIVEEKKRTRVLGTDIGVIRFDKLYREIKDEEEKYEKDLNRPPPETGS